MIIAELSLSYPANEWVGTNTMLKVRLHNQLSPNVVCTQGQRLDHFSCRHDYLPLLQCHCILQVFELLVIIGNGLDSEQLMPVCFSNICALTNLY